MADRDPLTDPVTPDQTDIGETVLAEPARDAVTESDPVVAPPKPAASPVKPVQLVQPRTRGGFLPAFAGGVVAAGIGFGLSHFNVLGLAPASPDLAALDTRLAAVESATTRTETELADLRAAPPAADPGLTDRIAALEAAGPAGAAADPRVDALNARMDTLEQQLAEAATSGSGVSGAALSALQAEVAALKSAAPTATGEVSAAVDRAEARLAEAEATAKALTDEAEAIAARARTASALGQLRAALDTGQPYAGALSLLEGAEIPDALAQDAEAGLPTLTALRDAFPDAARAALETALRSNMGESWSDRVTSFLRSQTGARSLTPREGNDPDAILSRAEAALTKGDLDETLREIATLPPDAQTAMADWVAQVERRRAAAAAIDTLTAKSGG